MPSSRRPYVREQVGSCIVTAQKNKQKGPFHFVFANCQRRKKPYAVDLHGARTLLLQMARPHDSGCAPTESILSARYWQRPWGAPALPISNLICSFGLEKNLDCFEHLHSCKSFSVSHDSPLTSLIFSCRLSPERLLLH